MNEIDDELEDTSLAEIKLRRGGKIRFTMYVNDEMMKADITDLDMSMRPTNGLRRAGFTSIGELVNSINGVEDLNRIRNLGRKSVEEIMLALMVYQYSVLSNEKKKNYIQNLKELNGIV